MTNAELLTHSFLSTAQADGLNVGASADDFDVRAAGALWIRRLAVLHSEELPP